MRHVIIAGIVLSQRHLHVALIEKSTGSPMVRRNLPALQEVGQNIFIFARTQSSYHYLQKSPRKHGWEVGAACQRPPMLSSLLKFDWEIVFLFKAVAPLVSPVRP